MQADVSLRCSIHRIKYHLWDTRLQHSGNQEKTMARELRESNSDKFNEHPKTSDQQISIDRQEPTQYLDLDGGSLDLILPDEDGGHPGWYRPNITLLLDRDTGEVMRSSKMGGTAQ